MRSVMTARGAPISARMHWQWADIFRGLAALLVCAGHLRSALFVDFGEAGGGPWVPLLYMATALGHQAVMIFFVLSGFLVGGSVLRTRAKFSTRDYAIARLSRLWTVLIPALLLTLAADLVLGRIAPAVLDGALRGTWGSTPDPDHYSLGPETFLANLFFLQTLAAPVYGSNGPLWSLAYEFWYYAAFPVIVWVARGSRAKLLGRVVAALGLGLLAWLTPVRMLYGFAIWLMGVLVWELVKVPRRWLQQPLAAAMSWLLFLGAVLVSCARLPWLSSEVADLLIGGSFALLLASLLQQRRQPTLQSRLGALLAFLSRVSYSLYATHFPLIPGRELVDDMLTRADSPIFGIVMVRRSRVLEVGPFDARLPTLADVDMWLRLASRYDVAYVAEPLYAIAAREVDHHNTYVNWNVRREYELIYELNWRRRFTKEPEAAERVRRVIARMHHKQRALIVAACLRRARWQAAREGLEFIAQEPPFGARALPDAVTSWPELAERIGIQYAQSSALEHSADS